MSSSTEEMEWDENDVERIRHENIELLIDIAHLCNRRDRSKVENIFLLGKIGAGKSALVNTLIKVIAGKYIPKARCGEGVTQSKTLTLESYRYCGVTREDITNETQRDLVQGILPRLPTILDAAGRYNINTASLREILELIIGGYIPPGTSIGALEEQQDKYGVGALKELVYTESNPNWKVTKVVFVHSCLNTVPKNLVDCLHTVLRKTDPVTAKPLYTGDVYVVITKYDLVTNQNLYDCGSEERMLSMNEFKDVETEIAKEFNIQGALEDNRIRWVSYTDRVTKDNPFIDNIALKFIKRMVMPVNQPDVEPMKPLKYTTKMKLGMRQMCKCYNLMFILFIAFCFYIVILLFKLIKEPLRF